MRRVRAAGSLSPPLALRTFRPPCSAVLVRSARRSTLDGKQLATLRVSAQRRTGLRGAGPSLSPTCSNLSSSRLIIYSRPTHSWPLSNYQSLAVRLYRREERAASLWKAAGSLCSVRRDGSAHRLCDDGGAAS